MNFPGHVRETSSKFRECFPKQSGTNRKRIEQNQNNPGKTHRKHGTTREHGQTKKSKQTLIEEHTPYAFDKKTTHFGQSLNLVLRPTLHNPSTFTVL